MNNDNAGLILSLIVGVILVLVFMKHEAKDTYYVEYQVERYLYDTDEWVSTGKKRYSLKADNIEEVTKEIVLMENEMTSEFIVDSVTVLDYTIVSE